MTTMTDRDDLPVPLLGCLYCHAEGTITELQPRPLFGADFPRLVCSRCRSVALFDEDRERGQWRINYQRYNRDKRYFFAALCLGGVEWLSADEAVDLSTKSYIQRERVQQAKRGQLSWLKPQASLPPSISPTEQLFLSAKQVELYDKQRSIAVDSGALYITNAGLHLLGAAQQWAFDYNEVSATDFAESGWDIQLITNEQEYNIHCKYREDEMDPQLTIVILRTLMQQAGGI